MASEKKIITILGITGNQGNSVAQTYLNDPNWTIRGTTRNTSSEAAKALTAKGIQLYAADVDDPSTLKPAFRGAHVIFAMTDFWEPFFKVYEQLKHIDRASGEHAYKIEVQRGKGIVDTVAKVIAEEKEKNGKATLERFVWATLPDVKERTKGKFTYVFHFDSKAEVTRYIRDKQPEVWERTSLLNVGFYADNMVVMTKVFKAIKEKDGSYTFSQPGSLQALHPLIHISSDLGTLAKLLVDNKPGINLLGVSELISWEKFYELWSEITGHKAQVIQLPLEGRDKLQPGGLGRETSESMSASAEFGWGDDLVKPWEVDPNVKLISMREFIAKENWEPVYKNAVERE